MQTNAQTRKYIQDKLPAHAYSHLQTVNIKTLLHKTDMLKDALHAYTCIHASMHTCIHAHMHACMQAGRQACMNNCITAYVHTHIHVYMNTNMHTYIHIHTYIHTYMHACIHTCIHTYITLHGYYASRRHAMLCQAMYTSMHVYLMYNLGVFRAAKNHDKVTHLLCWKHNCCVIPQIRSNDKYTNPHD